MFTGNLFAGTDAAFAPTPVRQDDIVSFTLKNCVLDEIYATKDILIKFNWQIPKDWTFSTHLHALFKDDLYAGNVTYSESIVQKIKIKKRFEGEFNWKMIYEKEIHSNEDFAIEFYDYYNPSKRQVEYAYVAVIGGADSDSISTSVYSDFDSYFICEKNLSFPAILDTSNTVELNRESSTVKTLGRKYPFVVYHGSSYYYSGSLTATFIEPSESDRGGFDTEHGWNYRNRIDQFLSNGKPKIIKSFEGDIYMVLVTGNIARTENGHYQNISQKIDWVECGDPTKIADLYDNGFIDTDEDRE